MRAGFEPQFHRKVVHAARGAVWIALPHPKTVIPVKAYFYRTWQNEECLLLQQAGEIVLTPPVCF